MYCSDDFTGKYVLIDGRPVSVDLLYETVKDASSADKATEEACARMLDGKLLGNNLPNSLSYYKLLNIILNRNI